MLFLVPAFFKFSNSFDVIRTKTKKIGPLKIDQIEKKATKIWRNFCFPTFKKETFYNFFASHFLVAVKMLNRKNVGHFKKTKAGKNRSNRFRSCCSSVCKKSPSFHSLFRQYFWLFQDLSTSFRQRDESKLKLPKLFVQARTFANNLGLPSLKIILCVCIFWLQSEFRTAPTISDTKGCT